MPLVDQILPVQKQVPLEGLYLRQNLKEMATQIGRSLVLTDFLTDQNGVVATAGRDARFQIPPQIKNSSDWARFQELMAQADVTISSGSYFRRLATSQDILYQFEPGNTFEKLGQWRLHEGYKQRSPDLAVITRHLDFELPQKLIRSGRRIMIFTTDEVANSAEAKALNNGDTILVGSGRTGVDAGRMIEILAHEMGYRVIMMVSGPQVLDLLLKVERLDLLYITEAQVQIPFDNPAMVQTLLAGGKKLSELKEFHLSHQFNQENVVAEDGSFISQAFLKYERKDL